MLSVKNLGLRQNFAAQTVLPTAEKYRMRNVIQNISIRLLKSPPYEPDIRITDSDSGLLLKLVFDAEIIPLPGHTYGSLGILSKGVLYCGDAFTALWRKPDITPHAASPELMKQSLETILDLNPEWLACGHGLPLRMCEAQQVITEYLRN